MDTITESSSFEDGGNEQALATGTPVASPRPNTAVNAEEGDRSSAGSAPAPAVGPSYGEIASEHLSKLVPKLGRMATRAHTASAPYLTYAAKASQEAARFTADRAKRYVDKVHVQHRRGEAPPGHVDSAKVDWSGVGARFCSLSWYDRQLVEISRSSDGKQAKSSKVGKEGSYGPSGSQGGSIAEVDACDREEESGGSGVMSPSVQLRSEDVETGIGFGEREMSGQASVIATLKDLDPWVTAPLFEEHNAGGSAGGPMLSGLATDDSSGSSNGLRDCPSPPHGRPGDHILEYEQGVQTAAESLAACTTADATSSPEFIPAGVGPSGTGRQQHGMPEPESVTLPEAKCVDGSISPRGLSASTPSVAGTRATALLVDGEDAIVVSTEAYGTADDGIPRAVSAPPPPPNTPYSAMETLVRIEEEQLPLWDGSDDCGIGGEVSGLVNAEMPGIDSSEDLLLEWLRREASLGDAEAQFHLAQLFSPPRFEMKTECRECGEPFGVTRYRHHCRHCGGSFCHEHAWHEHPIPKLGLPGPQRVCTPCKRTLEVEDWRERVEWRLERVNAYMENRLIQYFDTGVDTVSDKALRVVDGAIYVAKAAPLGTVVKVSVEVMDVLMKYGTAGVAGLVLRREFVEAVDVLKRLSGVDKKWPMSVHEMTAAMYYLLAQRRGERGSDPNGEHHAHAGLPPVSDEELVFLRRISSLPLHFAYTKTALELQVLCNTMGWSLVFHKPDSRFHQPAFSLLVHRETMTAALVVRGTGSVHDVITDIQAIPVPFPPLRGDTAYGEDGWSELRPADTVACCGMARAAEWLHREVVHQLVRLHREGHKVIILGHSLGGGVAALLGVLLKDIIPDVRVVAFATPACADIGVSKICESFCTSVILHDDVVPCVTPQAVRALLKDLLHTKEGWVQHLYDDWDAVVGRAKGLWAPRWRSSSYPGVMRSRADLDEHDTAATVEPNADEDTVALGKEGKEGKLTARDGGEEDAMSVIASEEEDEWGGRGRYSKVGATIAAKGGGKVNPAGGSAGGPGTVPGWSGDEGPGPGPGSGKGGRGWVRGRWPALDVRAVQSRLSRLVDDTSAKIRSKIVVKDQDTLPTKVPPLPPRPRPTGSSATDNIASRSDNIASRSLGTGTEDHGEVKRGDGESVDDVGSMEDEAEVVEELPLPDLYIPGKIVHIYSQRGVYRATEVPRDHSCLRKIPMYGNMLADHGSLAYFDALEEIAAVRVAETNGQAMPEWTPFSESDKCQLCKADFTWASTSKSEAQRARDKHNCRMCGLLVCGPCSDHRKPLPRFGVLATCRVCDRCFYGADPTAVA